MRYTSLSFMKILLPEIV